MDKHPTLAVWDKAVELREIWLRELEACGDKWRQLYAAERILRSLGLAIPFEVAFGGTA